jgi:hypothetical protein
MRNIIICGGFALYNKQPIRRIPMLEEKRSSSAVHRSMRFFREQNQVNQHLLGLKKWSDNVCRENGLDELLAILLY